MAYKNHDDKIAWDRAYRLKKKQRQVPQILFDIHKKFSEKELRALSKGVGVGRVDPLKVNIDFHGDVIRFGFFTDPHMGSIYYHPEFMDSFVQRCEEGKADFVVCGGDVTHGMDPSKYNLLYELTEIGYAAQKDYAISQLRRIPFPLYMVDGNHDRWYEALGAHIVEDICKEVPGSKYLGRDEGDIEIRGIKIKVWHGEDGNSYATSYRIQKLIESLTGGEKPNVLLCGHRSEEHNV